MSRATVGARNVIMLALTALAMTLVLAACGQDDPTATPLPTATPTSPTRAGAAP